MSKYSSNTVVIWLLLAALAVSFWFSAGWTRLAGGLALFLFGMQCLEEGLRLLAGGELERFLARATDRAWKSLSFGVLATVTVQSSTLVSLLTIAFLGTGLIGLGAGLCIVFGANLGTTSGIWLLALAGQSASLGDLALPLAVFGILLGFNGPRSKGVGRVLLGICFLFFGIDLIKGGFSDATEMFDPAQFKVPGILGILLFVGIGALVTAVVQSSHASLMLVLTALSSGQIDVDQAFALAIGTNVGGVVTAVVGALGGARAGMRLALANVIFNLVVAVLALLLLQPLTALVLLIAAQLGFAGNALLELALFHTPLFNGLGVLLFLPLHRRLAAALERWLPEVAEPHVLIAAVQGSAAPEAAKVPTRARYLDDNALDSADAAVQAVARELQHLARPEPGGDLPRPVPADRPAAQRADRRARPARVGAERQSRAGRRPALPAAHQGRVQRPGQLHGPPQGQPRRRPPAGLDRQPGGGAAAGRRGEGRQAPAEEPRPPAQRPVCGLQRRLRRPAPAHALGAARDPHH